MTLGSVAMHVLALVCYLVALVLEGKGVLILKRDGVSSQQGMVSFNQPDSWREDGVTWLLAGLIVSTLGNVASWFS